MAIDPESVISALANAMGYNGTTDIAERYLRGEDIRLDVGRRGKWHFDHMMRTIGLEPPEPRAKGGG